MMRSLRRKSTSENERGGGKSGVYARAVHGGGGAILDDVFPVRRWKTGCWQVMLLLLSWWMGIWVELDETWLAVDLSEPPWLFALPSDCFTNQGAKGGVRQIKKPREKRGQVLHYIDRSHGRMARHPASLTRH